MGFEASIALAAISAGATVGKMSAEKEAEQANLSALNQQSRLSQLQYQQKTLQNLELTHQMLSKQAAQLSTRGVAFDSPSFNAIQRETLNTAARKQTNQNTEESLTNQFYDIEKKNVKNTLHAQLFGDTANLALTALNIGDKFPTKGSLPQVEDI